MNSKRQQVYQDHSAFVAVVALVLAVVVGGGVAAYFATTERYYEISENEYGVYKGESRFLFFRNTDYTFAEGPTEFSVANENDSAFVIPRSGATIDFQVRVVDGALERTLDNTPDAIRDSGIGRAIGRMVTVKPRLFSGQLVLGDLPPSAAYKLFEEVEGPNLGEPLIDELQGALREHFDESDEPDFQQMVSDTLAEELGENWNIDGATVVISSKREVDVESEEYAGKLPTIVSSPAASAEKSARFFLDKFLMAWPLMALVIGAVLLIAFTCPDLIIALAAFSTLSG